MIDSAFVEALGVLLMLPQQPEQGAGDGTDPDLGVGDREAPGGLAGLDIAQGARGQAVGLVEQVEAPAGEEAGHVGVSPAKPSGDPE